MKFLGLGDNVIDYYSNLGVMYPGGYAVNTAAHAAILGEEAAYLGNLGDDEMSEVIRDCLLCTSVDTGREGCYYEEYRDMPRAEGNLTMQPRSVAVCIGARPEEMSNISE